LEEEGRRDPAVDILSGFEFPSILKKASKVYYGSTAVKPKLQVLDSFEMGHQIDSITLRNASQLPTTLSYHFEARAPSSRESKEEVTWVAAHASSDSKEKKRTEIVIPR